MRDPKLSSVVTNPHIKGAMKKKAVADALVKEKMSPITLNFVSKWSLIVDKHRVNCHCDLNIVVQQSCC